MLYVRAHRYVRLSTALNEPAFRSAWASGSTAVSGRMVPSTTPPPSSSPGAWRPYTNRNMALISGAWTVWFQNTPSLDPASITSAALAAPAAGST